MSSTLVLSGAFVVTGWVLLIVAMVFEAKHVIKTNTALTLYICAMVCILVATILVSNLLVIIAVTVILGLMLTLIRWGRRV